MHGKRLVGLLLAVGLMTGCGQVPTGRMATADRYVQAQSFVDQEVGFLSIQADLDDMDAAFEEDDPTGGDQPPAGPQVRRSVNRTNKDGSTTVRNYFNDGSMQVLRTAADGKVLMDEGFSAPTESTASVEVPAGAKTLVVQVTYKVTPNGSTGSGSMLRSYVSRKLFRSETSMTLTTAAGEAVSRSRIAEGYDHGRATHVLTTAKNKRGDYKLETTLDPATGVKVSKGELTKPDGTVVTTTTTQNPDKSKVRVTENTKTKQRITLNYNADKTGTGKIEDLSSDPAVEIATIQWDSSGKGTVTYKDGKVRKFHA